MPPTNKQQLNTTTANSPKPKTSRELRLEFWGNANGNQLLNK